MAGLVGETVITCPSETSSSFSERKKELTPLKEIIPAICALLNSNGGKVVLHYDNKNVSIRTLEQFLISIIGIHQTSSNIYFKEDKESILISVKKADSLITTSYNLCLPSQTQVVQVSSLEPLEKIRDDIIKRKVVLQAVQLGSHCKIFLKDKDCGFQESKFAQLKCLKANRSKRTRLADRMTSKGNKFSCYVSAFANYEGGHIYYGITDDGIVEGELISSEEDMCEITKKVEKAIKKMIWPEQIGQPKRGVEWEIFFEQVVDEDLKPIPSNFVIVVYIAPCLGGVFTEVPECYEMVEGKVEKMSFATWERRVMQAVWLYSKEEIPSIVHRVAWSSSSTEHLCSKVDEMLMGAINNAQWQVFLHLAKHFNESYPENLEIRLIVLSKRVITCCRRSYFKKAKHLLSEYNNTMSNTKDLPIFGAVALYLQIALTRAEQTLDLNIIAEVLSMVEIIPPGNISASLLVLAATSSTKENGQQRDEVSQQLLCERALEHLQKVGKPNTITTDLVRKAHINLANQHLGCSFSQSLVLMDRKEVDLDRAKSSIAAVKQSIEKESPLARYREIQFDNAQSILHYRCSQVPNDHSEDNLIEALHFCRRAKRRAKDCQFQEMMEWTTASEGLYTEELVRAQFMKIRKITDANTD